MKCIDCGSNQIRNEKCEHCGGTAFQENCAVCLHAIPLRAKFCPRCASPVNSLASKTESGPNCPDCGNPTEKEIHGKVVTFRCQNCKGIWIPKTEWNALREQAESSIEKSEIPKKDACEQPYRKCPVCSEMMGRKTPEPKMPILDICWQHGFWLDAGELQTTIAAMRHNRKPINPKAHVTPELLELQLLQQKAQNQAEFRNEKTLLGEIFRIVF